ncbi:galactosylgalactosylxylosylprotein 3-beta-glucuronosyltransferase P-like isoform X1 [Homarus americanus]|uniref:galactosylgalactosylxylosylprotein 3-beta-glucuronosyltransferase P-like isoform X1 n=1 Tax=Homarus americanus TaxID=6706 RepID=UPI001C43741B|nr:galactosylgalactosylxylosylprotein 3-beta-glucuronosyltransferase P-like isoform X1 [Homarus americanus]
MDEQLRVDHIKLCGRWSGMVALFRTVVGVSLVSGLLVMLLWSEQQVGVKTPAHIHFHAHARGIPEGGPNSQDAQDTAPDSSFQSLSVKFGAPRTVLSSHNITFLGNKTVEAGVTTSPGHHEATGQSSHVPAQASHAPDTTTSINGSKLVFTIDQSDPSPATPKIYVITPTYRRPEQVAELTRLAQTLMLVPNLHWLVVEDAVAPTRRVLSFLDTCSVPHTYLLGMASRRYKGANKPRGVSNRNAGLKWLKGHAKEGIIYFADDDNTYDYRIFQEIRETKQVSMFPVGLVTRLGVSSPIVSGGKIIGFYDGWIAGRKFPVDMAGFAVNVKFYLKKNAPLMPYNVGFEEDGFLKALKIKPEEIEPLADNCTKILVWHTRTVKSLPALKMPDSDKVTKTNLNYLKSQMVFQLPYGLS